MSYHHLGILDKACRDLARWGPVLLVGCWGLRCGVSHEAVALEVDAPTAGLRCELSAQIEEGGASTSLVMVLRNEGTEPVRFLQRYLPHPDQLGEVVGVEYLGAEVEFHGVEPLHLPPTEESFVEIASGGDLATRYPLSRHFHFGQPGRYVVTLGASEVVTSLAGDRLPLDCAAVEFEHPTGETGGQLYLEQSDAPSPLALSGFNNCSVTQQYDILHAEFRAKWVVDLVLGKHGGVNQIDSSSKFYQRWFGAWTGSRGSLVYDVFDEISDRLTNGISSGADYECETSCSAPPGTVTIAYVVRPFPDVIHICPAFFNQMEVGFISKVGTIVHELGHWSEGALGHDNPPVCFDPSSCMAAAAIDPDGVVEDAFSYGFLAEDVYRGLGPAADVDGDGYSDLVTVRDDSGFGYAYTYPGDASRAFDEGGRADSFNGTMDSALWDNTMHWVVGIDDVDADGLDDLVTHFSDGRIYTYRGMSSGGFASGIATGIAGQFNSALDDGVGLEPVGLADVDGDFLADLVMLSSAGYVNVYRGLLSGRFSTTPVQSFGGTMPSAYFGGAGHYVIDVADVTGDGYADLVSTKLGYVYVYPGTASGAFLGVSHAGINFHGTYDLAVYDGVGHEPIGVADVDADGYADLISHYMGSIYVYPGGQAGLFYAPTMSFGGNMPSSLFGGGGYEIIGLLDVDGNGLRDLVTAHTDGYVRTFEAHSNGWFNGATYNFNGTMDSGRHDDYGHEFITEQREIRRRGCPSTGC